MEGLTIKHNEELERAYGKWVLVRRSLEIMRRPSASSASGVAPGSRQRARAYARAPHPRVGSP